MTRSPNTPKKPITRTPAHEPSRKRRATPGFGEDGSGERITKRVKREVEKPTLENES